MWQVRKFIVNAKRYLANQQRLSTNLGYNNNLKKNNKNRYFYPFK